MAVVYDDSRRLQPKAWRWIRLNPNIAAGSLMLCLAVLVATAGPHLVNADPLQPNPSIARHPPSEENFFGTDAAGRDILSRVVYAIQLDLGVALIISVVATTLGGAIGMAAAYWGGWLDQALMRITDVLMALPGFILAVAIASVLGSSVQTVVIAISVAYTPTAVRLVRAQSLTLREAAFIDASRATGTPSWQIIVFHLLPNILPVLLVQATLFLGWAILDTAGLSFIGLGIRPPTPELGSLTAEGAQYMISGDWWMSVFPGGVIVILVLAFNLLGDGLRDLLDPRRRV